MGEQDWLNLSALCDRLSISPSTGRNWLKSGQLIPDGRTENGRPLFLRRTAEDLVSALAADPHSRLRSRRNKSCVSGRQTYLRYISPDSRNAAPLEAVLADAGEVDPGECGEDLIRVVLGEYGLRLLSQAVVMDLPPQADGGFLLEALFDGQLNPGGYGRLVTDLVCDSPRVRRVLRGNPGLFSHSLTLCPREDILGALYLSLKNLGERKNLGAYYTPVPLADRLIAMTGLAHENALGRILDPSCGTGNFLLRLPDNVEPRQIWGMDVDPVSVSLTRLNLALRYPGRGVDWLYRQIRVGDFLHSPSNEKFRLILGNPPWGAGYDREEKSFLAGKYHSAGIRPESSDIFVEESLNRLEIGGTLAFILPESILHVKSHSAIRRIILERCRIRAVSYLGEVFHGVQCPSVLLLLSHTGKQSSTEGMRVEAGGRSFLINIPRAVLPDRFSFLMTDEEYEIAEKLKDPRNREYLAGQADFALGIVTGDNRRYLSKVPRPDAEPVLLGTDIHRYRVAAPRRWLRYDPEQFQQTAAEEYYRTREKLVYRFVSRDLMFACDTAGRLTLNSANILIPRLPDTDIYFVLAVLNSRMARFLYARDFHSLKVLRSHLEALPLPLGSREEKESVAALARNLATTAPGRESSALYDEIDLRLAGLYGLDDAEYRCLCGAIQS